MEKKNLENEVSKYLDALVGDYQKEFCNPDADYLMSKDDMLDFATHFVNWQKEQIIKRLCNHANIDQMVEKFEDKYKPQKVLDTEYYKRGIFDTIKAIKED